MPENTNLIRGNICKGCGVQGSEYLREYSENTTLHGVRYVGETKAHYTEKLFWVITILTCAIFCGLEVAKLWSRWQSSPVIVSFSARPTNVASIPLPALTVCPENKVRRSVVDLAKQMDLLAKQLDGKAKFESPEKQLEAEAISLVCVSKDKQFTPLLPSKFEPTRKHKELIEKVISPRFEDTFVKCYFEAVAVDCSKIFRPIMTNYGMCFSFNTLDDNELYSIWQNVTMDPGSPRKSRWNPEEGYDFPRKDNDFPWRAGVYVGQMMGLQVFLKSPLEDLQETCSWGSAGNFRVTLQSPVEFPDGIYGNYFQVTPRNEFSVSLRPSTVVTAPELREGRYTPVVRGCFFPEDRKLRLFRTYTEGNCILECENTLFRQHRGCQYIVYPFEKKDNVTYCSVDSTQTNNFGENFTAIYNKTFYKDVENQLDKEGVAAVCGCLPSCTELKYDYYVTSTKFDPVTHSGYEMERQKEANATRKENYSIINLFYEDPTFFGKRRSELYGVTDFIASSGGLLGLYTGFSLMTLVELCYFASLRLACRVRRNRATDMQEQMAP